MHATKNFTGFTVNHIESEEKVLKFSVNMDNDYLI